MKGFGAHELLAGSPAAKRVGAGWIHGRMLDLGDYPGVVVDGAAGRVAGEVWEVPTGSLRKLDAYEEYFPRRKPQSLFVRVRLDVHVGNRAVAAWVYLVNRPPRGARTVAGGRWRGRKPRSSP
jgi:gamma-glutamylcyclotransferase (GGCT)/AIG2-like uncharacterized protein YtfP